MSEVLPCPFCGGESAVTSYRSCDCCGKAYNGSVSCTACEAAISHLDTDGEAIAKWNARATLPGWQPIATAPKDVQVLICGQAYLGHYSAVAKLINGLWLLFDPAMDDFTVESSGHSHWMPLPTPPEVQS